MSKKKEEKFLVINIAKRKEEMFNACNNKSDVNNVSAIIDNFEEAVAEFAHDYKLITGKDLNQKYIVCNQDEPYANKVWNIILGK